MKRTKIISKIEEKYLFNISLTFWRLLIGIGAIGAVLGILLLLWGILPPIKKSVDKAKYPPIVTFSANDLKTKVVPQQLKATTATVKEEVTKQEKNKTQEVKQSGITEAEKSFNTSLAKLKELIPAKYNAKLSSGHWYYPHGKDYWEHYRRDKYRKWIVDSKGLNGLLTSVYYKTNAKAFTEKKKIVDAYIETVQLFSEDKRVSVIKALTSYSKNNVSQTIKNVELLHNSISNFSTEDTKYLTALAKFGSRNPKDGYSFIAYVNKIIGNFDDSNRKDVLEELIQSYYSFFDTENRGISTQVEATNLFIPMIPEFEPKIQSKALNEFYKMYFDKNAARERSIRNIQSEYQSDVAKVEAAYQINKEKKTQIRLRGLYLIGSGLVLVAFLALILVFLSIHKSVKKIELEMEKNRKEER